MNQSLMRDNKGRIIGTIEEYWIDEDESYFDYREPELIFPRHNQGKIAPVHTYHISELNKN